MLLIILALSCVVVPQLVMVYLLRFPAAKVAVAHYLTPAITIILAMIFLGEGFNPAIVIALLLAILGAWMVARDRIADLRK